MRRSVIIGSIIAFTVFAIFASASPKGQTMLTPSDAALMLERQGALFDGGSPALTKAELALSRTDFRGVAVTAPSHVQTDMHSTVPVVVLSQQTILRAWEVSEQHNLMLVLTDLESGRVHAARALVDPKDEEPPGVRAAPRPPKPEGLAATATSTKAHRFDVRVTPGQRGALAVAAIMFDMASNTAKVDLAGAKARPPAAPPPISPMPNAAQGVPSYALTNRTPQAPRNGVAFEIEMVGARVFVYGAFAKTLAPSERLQAAQNVRDNGTDRLVGAIVPLTIALVGLDWKAPRLYPLTVPVYGAAQVAPGQAVTGQFANAVSPASPLVPGQYVAYVFMEGVAYGPQRLQVQ